MEKRGFCTPPNTPAFLRLGDMVLFTLKSKGNFSELTLKSKGNLCTFLEKYQKREGFRLLHRKIYRTARRAGFQPLAESAEIPHTPNDLCAG